jgi:hypothetical protein
MDVLIPENKLVVSNALLTRVMKKNPNVRWSEMDWGVKEAYARYAALLDNDVKSYLGVDDLLEPIAFYNAYYWSLVFVKRYNIRYGFDAGIEQQSFKVLERAPANVDWAITEQVAEFANRI